ncbi:MAG: DNA polymerase III subunit beta [Muribaculaceae bacterium]|nr:DNA polymerase III subunit beta [Muribaculaceae bacterium]
MKFNISGKSFLSQLQAVSKVINAKNAITILDNFLLKLDGDILYITGSDSENVMTAKVEVMDSDGEGEVAIGAKRLLEIVKEVAAQPLSIELDEGNMLAKLTFPTGEFSFPAISGSEYPRKKEQEAEKIEMTIPASVLAKGIENTIFAVSQEMIRPIMTGIFFDIKPENITFVSSDTHKLVKYTNSTVAPGVELGFILPSKPAGIIRSCITKEDDEVKISADSKGAVFNFGTYEVSCRFIKGNYPPYNRVIPQDNPYKLVVDRETLLNATRRVSILANKASNLIRMAIGASAIELTSQDLDYSTAARESVMCDYEGNPMTIGFNSDYMKEVLSNLKGESIIVELSDPTRPGLFMPSEKEAGEEIVMLQMPMQVFE